MSEPLAARLRRNWPDVAFWIAFVVFALALSINNVRKNYKKDQTALRDTAIDFDVSDFECFYRGALRLHRGEIAYWPADGSARSEMATGLPPFQQLVLVPLVSLAAWRAEIVYSLVSWGLLAWTLVLGQQLAERARGSPVSPWLVRIAFLLLIPFVVLVGRYNQTGFFLVFPICAALVLLPRRPFVAGAVLALSAALKVVPIVVLAWLVWKRAWRAFLGYVLCLVVTTAAFYVHQGPELATKQIQGYIDLIRRDRGFEDYNERYQGLPNMIRATITPKYETSLESRAQEIGWDGVRNFLPSEFLMDHSTIVVSLACALIVLGCAVGCRPRWPDSERRRLGEIGLVLTAMLLISPHTWKHYYWVLFPAVLFVLVEVTERRRWARLALGVVIILLTLPHRTAMPFVWMYLHVFHVFVLGLLLLWGCLTWRLWRGRASDPEFANESEPAPPPA